MESGFQNIDDGTIEEILRLLKTADDAAARILALGARDGMVSARAEAIRRDVFEIGRVLHEQKMSRVRAALIAGSVAAGGARLDHAGGE